MNAIFINLMRILSRTLDIHIVHYDVILSHYNTCRKVGLYLNFLFVSHINEVISEMGNSTNEEALSECCRQCASGEGTKFSVKDLAITGCLAFVAGAVLVLLVLFVVTLKRNKKLCFKEKVEPFRGKWEGASDKATIQVLRKHTLEKPREYDTPAKEDPSLQRVTNVSERKLSYVDLTVKSEETEIPVKKEETNIGRTAEVTTSSPAEVTTSSPAELTTSSPAEVTTSNPAEVTTSSPAEVTNPEEVTNVNDQREDTDTNIPADKDQDENAEKETENKPSNDILRTNLALTDPSLRPSHLYEKSRGSSVYEQEDLVLQNANFRLSALSNI